MKEYLIFAGTVEGRMLAEYCSKNRIAATVSVATEYGEALVNQLEGITVRTGRLDEGQMCALMREHSYAGVVDATHPYAEVVSENIRSACELTGSAYVRLLRAESDLEHLPGLQLFDDTESAANWLEQQDGNILLTTGLKELPVFAETITDRERIYARVLLQQGVFELMERYQLAKKQILCMQGPFSKELNEAMIRQLDAAYLVTKESGKAGGFMEKAEAAASCGITCVVIRRPVREEGYSFAEVRKLLAEENGITDAEIGETEPSAIRKVTLLGIGMGSADSMTVEAVNACRDADMIIGARRMLGTLSGFGKPMEQMYLPDEICAYICIHKEYKNIVVGLSGDVGFYSGATKLRAKLENMEDTLQIREVCGISSVVYLASRLGMTWEDMALVSVHGRSQNLVSALQHNIKVFALASDGASIRAMAAQLMEYGYGELPMHVGSNLSYPDESVCSGLVKEFEDFETDGVCAVILENPQASGTVVTHGLPDEAFLRAKVPMTKEEIRSISLSKLQLTRDAVIYDIGAGTGSVSLECARMADRGMVYAIERKEEALDLIRENKIHLGVTNLEVIPGMAPDAITDLPVPTHAFIGGSGGNLRQIVDTLLEKNPGIRIVINCIALDTLAEVMTLIREREPKQLDICGVSIGKSRTLAGYHMMTGQNPIYVITLDYK